MDHPEPAISEADRVTVETWVNRSQSQHTRRGYRRHAARFLTHLNRPLATATLADVQGFLASLSGAPSSYATTTAAVKSLLSFAQESGAVRSNAAKAVRVPRIREALAERILTERDVLRMLDGEPDPRNHALLTLAYSGGLRVSEVVGLRWRDAVPRDDGSATLSIFGKGARTRHVLISASTWKEVAALRGDAMPAAPVFLSRQGGHLDPSTAHDVVKRAAARAGLSPAVSMHFLRHSHASHAIDRNAPLHLVKQTLGHASLETTGRYLHARPTDGSSRYLGV